MYLKIRKLFAKENDKDLIVNISKNAFIQELRTIVFNELGVELNQQKLYYKGKQLVDDHRVIDYDIQLNDVIQLMVAQKLDETASPPKEIEEAAKAEPSTSKQERPEQKCQSKYYEVGDAVDVVDEEYGAWFEARIVDILQVKAPQDCSDSNKEPGVVFRVKMEYEKGDATIDKVFDEIRLRCRYKYKRSELRVKQEVLVNYNVEKPSTRGFWYNFIIDKVNIRNLKGTIMVGKTRMTIEDCTVLYIDEVMKIPEVVLMCHRSDDFKLPLLPLRKNVYYCEKCKDVDEKPCRACGCKICAGKEDANRIILCDECDYGYHTQCLDPPLSEVPLGPEDWYCPDCKIDTKAIIGAGEKLRFSAKRSRMISAKQDKGAAPLRDWGRGMACIGRTTECTLVPKDHYGPIPGVEVGTCWKFRVQASEAGVHRPHVAGIHGRETDGAYSLVLSGGYEDDVDNGDEFIYTGSGGRDLSGNKRVSDQSCDQALTRMNKALALNCNAPLNENGAEAADWKAGKPVRVVRNYKLGKHSKYSPKDGNRYDGIYKVVKYYPEKGKSGFLVWKYLLRRDDPMPAPWHNGGREYDILYPPGFLEAQANKGGTKRKVSEVDKSPVQAKKQKVEPFRLSQKAYEYIELDERNQKLWDECRVCLEMGKQAFLAKVEELFMCVCCQEVVYLPVTTECKHNVCKSCLKRSFASEIFSCPYCRFPLEKDFKMEVNDNLSTVLLYLFPGYEAGR